MPVRRFSVCVLNDSVGRGLEDIRILNKFLEHFECGCVIIPVAYPLVGHRLEVNILAFVDISLAVNFVFGTLHTISKENGQVSEVI